MKTIHCPKDIGFVNTFNGEDCKREQFYNDCYHCWTSAIVDIRPQGKWIVYPLMDEGRVELECPICGDTFIRAVDYKPHFCENCGARME